MLRESPGAFEMMTFSIIVPVFNEAPGIAEFLDTLRAVIGSSEIIVADGGSTDDTAALCATKVDRIVQTGRGRSLQMNAGAAAAQGDVLWFVHADSSVSVDCIARMQEFLGEPRNVGGCFSLRIDSSRWIYRIRDAVGNLCVDLFGIALGDRALFCRRDVFERIHGYRELPLLEDGDFYQRIRKAGGVARLPAIVRTSARRYEKLGAARTITVYAIIVLLYCARLPMRLLERILAWHLRRATK